MFSQKELIRYNRHIILSEIGLQGQEKLRQAKVLVVGAGGLGCPVLQYLTAAGVGTIGVCDFDFVDESNLQRQILFGSTDIGKSKAIVAVEKLKNLNPYIIFVVHNELLTRDNALEIINKYDIVVDASDNFPTRFLMNDACVILNKPYVFGAIYKFEGQVTVFNYNGGPTYRCLVPEQPESSEALSCSNIGVIGVLPGIIGSYQALEVIKIITGAGKVLSGKLLVIDTFRLDFSLITFERSQNFSVITELGIYGDICTDRFSGIRQISPAELHEKLKNEEILVIDIREKEQFESFHIEGKQISIGIILENPDLLPENKLVVFVCERGINSMAIIEELQRSGGKKNLVNLEGGILAWLKRNLPVIKENT